MAPERKYVFSDRLKRSREKAELSVRELADEAEITGAYVSYMERGIKSPTIEVCEALARALGVSPTWLAGWKK